MCFHAAIVHFHVIGNLSCLVLVLHVWVFHSFSSGFSMRRYAFSFSQFTSCVFGAYVVVSVKLMTCLCFGAQALFIFMNKPAN